MCYVTTDIAISSEHKESLIYKINVTAISSITRERCMKMVKRSITYYNIIVLFLEYESGKVKKRSNNDYSFLILMGHCSIMFLHTQHHLCTFYTVKIFLTLCNFGTLRFKLLMRNLLCKVAWKGVINAHTFNCKRLIAFQDHYLLSFLHSNLTLQKNVFVFLGANV